MGKGATSMWPVLPQVRRGEPRGSIYASRAPLSVRQRTLPMTDLFGVHWNPRGPPRTLREAMQGNRIVDDGLIDEAVAALKRGDISSHLVRAMIRRIDELENTNRALVKQLPDHKLDKHRGRWE